MRRRADRDRRQRPQRQRVAGSHWAMSRSIANWQNGDRIDVEFPFDVRQVVADDAGEGDARPRRHRARTNRLLRRVAGRADGRALALRLDAGDAR